MNELHTKTVYCGCCSVFKLFHSVVKSLVMVTCDWNFNSNVNSEDSCCAELDAVIMMSFYRILADCVIECIFKEVFELDVAGGEAYNGECL